MAVPTGGRAKVDRFRSLAQAALSSGSTAGATEALSLYGGPLLHDDLRTASAIEGSWPYVPVLEALGDLCRLHLLDGLNDWVVWVAFRPEPPLPWGAEQLPTHQTERKA